MNLQSWRYILLVRDLDRKAHFYQSGHESGADAPHQLLRTNQCDHVAVSDITY